MKKFLLLLIIFSITSFSQDDQLSFYSFKQKFIKDINNVSVSETKFSRGEITTRKKTGLAIIYSLLVPGMGELYADSYDSGVYFTVADGLLWGTLIGMNVYGNWQKDRYIAFAQGRAGISTNNKDEAYYATISQYLNIEDYNNEKAFERNFDEMYDTQTYFWKWNSSEDRKSYRSMWVSSEQTFNNLRFVIGALIVNRVVSAINAVRLVSKYNKNLEQEMSWNVYLGVQTNPDNTSQFNINFLAGF